MSSRPSNPQMSRRSSWISASERGLERTSRAKAARSWSLSDEWSHASALVLVPALAWGAGGAVEEDEVDGVGGERREGSGSRSRLASGAGAWATEKGALGGRRSRTSCRASLTRRGSGRLDEVDEARAVNRACAAGSGAWLAMLVRALQMALCSQAADRGRGRVARARATSRRSSRPRSPLRTVIESVRHALGSPAGLVRATVLSRPILSLLPGRQTACSPPSPRPAFSSAKRLYLVSRFLCATVLVCNSVHGARKRTVRRDIGLCTRSRSARLCFSSTVARPTGVRWPDRSRLLARLAQPLDRGRCTRLEVRGAGD